MIRIAIDRLKDWAARPRRKPLVIRGARQVGKTTLVRLFAQQRSLDLIELNLEREPALASLFDGNDPTATLRRLEVHLERDIVPGHCMLFLDEIQAAPTLFAALRYFYEELPELHVVAAGSLLETILEQPVVSVPVGRIEYLHLGPMTFGELLLAAGRDRLERFVRTYEIGQELPDAIHHELLAWLHRYLIVGGMPESVASFLDGDQSFRSSEAAKHSILSTYRDDFGKYGARAQHARMRKVFDRVPYLVGNKLKYVNIDRGERAKDLSAALHLLSLARVAYRVRHSSANGVPLGAEADDRKMKLLFLDVGLMATATGLSVLDLEGSQDLLAVNQGALCEQFVGQHLLYAGESWEEPRLYYWAREKSTSSAEVDFVIAEGRRVIPVEVKAGKTGTLKSLHVFLREKRRSLAIRFNTDKPSVLDATTSLPDGADVPFRLVSLPLYMVEQARRLCRDIKTGY